MVVGTKLDLVDDRSRVDSFREKVEALGFPFCAVSAVTGEGMDQMLEETWRLLKAARGEEGTEGEWKED